MAKKEPKVTCTGKLDVNRLGKVLAFILSEQTGIDWVLTGISSNKKKEATK